MEYLLAFALGAIFGAMVVILVNYFQKHRARELAQELVNQTQQQKTQELEILLNRVKDAFGSLSMEALKKVRKNFSRWLTRSSASKPEAAKWSSKEKEIDRSEPGKHED